MRILLLGAHGQVGFELKRAFAPLGDVHALARTQLDVSDAAAITQTVETLRPELILNAAAYTQVDRAEDEPLLSEAINHRAVAALGAAAKPLGALVVHYSTDYVFAGGLTRPYREDDALGPTSVYGRSKMQGEQALRDSGADHLIFRTAWVYAARGNNFVRTMLRLARERDSLGVVNDQTGAPTPARWLAAATALAISRWQRAPVRSQLHGTYHLSAGGATTWHAFAQEIFSRAHARGLLPRIPSLRALSSAEFGAKAPRPHYSVLDNQRLQRTFNLKLPDWGVGLDEVLEEMS
jgi:dTDP-4-dehydrorhamnose reductase